MVWRKVLVWVSLIGSTVLSVVAASSTTHSVLEWFAAFFSFLFVYIAVIVTFGVWGFFGVMFYKGEL